MPSPTPTVVMSPIGRKLALSFTLVSVLAAMQCVIHVLLISHVAGAVAEMRGHEGLIREGLDLATAVREQYIHAAHNIAQGDRSHLEHYGKWVERIAAGTERLSKRVTPSERAELVRIAAASRQFDGIFREQVLPALDRGDTATVRRVHAQSETILGRAAHMADRLARGFERRMSHAHVSTTRVTHLGATLAVLGILLIVTVAVIATRQIRRAVIEPLGRLTQAAVEIGKGRFELSVGPVGDGEFRELAQAFERTAAELHKREAQLVQSERMAAIGQLAAGIAHEINNPIGIIRGYLRTMLPEAQSEALKEELRILDEEAAACQRIAEDLLAYARTPELTKERVLIDQLLEDAASRFGSTSIQASMTRVRVEAEPASMLVDAVRLRQVIHNLARNAIDAGSPEVDILGRRLGDSGYVILVSDRGRGIPADASARIFEPFFSTRRAGTGLGLAVCSGIVRAHGGSIGANAREGGGTEIVVTLPAG
jgi:two-component system NtrC family sensor kinase